MYDKDERDSIRVGKEVSPETSLQGNLSGRQRGGVRDFIVEGSEKTRRMGRVKKKINMEGRDLRFEVLSSMKQKKQACPGCESLVRILFHP